jgi:hypothetical protein
MQPSVVINGLLIHIVGVGTPAILFARAAARRPPVPLDRPAAR